MSRFPVVVTNGGRRLLPPSLIAAVFAPLIGGVVCIGGWAWWQFGSSSAAVALLGGEALYVERRTPEMGPWQLGERREVTIRVSNLTSRPVTLLGMPGYCGKTGCVAYKASFPIDLGPWGSSDIDLLVEAPKLPGHPMKINTHVYTSIGNARFTISGDVHPPASAGLRTCTSRPPRLWVRLNESQVAPANFRSSARLSQSLAVVSRNSRLPHR